MTILGIDPGSQCGWAIGRDDYVIESGVWQLKPGVGESPGMRYLRLRAKMAVVREAYPRLALICYEQAHHRGRAATEYGIGVATTIQAWAAEWKIEHSHVHAATLKKWATGSGRASKEDMVRCGREKFGRLEATHDEIDALWILNWAMENGG